MLVSFAHDDLAGEAIINRIKRFLLLNQNGSLVVKLAFFALDNMLLCYSDGIFFH